MKRGIVALLTAVLMICNIVPVAAEPAELSLISEEAEQASMTPGPDVTPEPVASADAESSTDAVPQATELPAADASPHATASEPEVAEQAVIRARVAGEGALTVSSEDGDTVEISDDGSFSVDQGSMIQVDAVPESGSEYVMARYNGRRVEADVRPGKARRLSIVATESGDLEVTFARQHTVRLALSGNATVTAGTDAGERHLADGESVQIGSGSALTCRITPVKGSDFDGADFNGKPVAAVKEGDAWVFTLPVREDGVLTVRCTTACMVSTILDHTELQYDNDGSWQAVREGDNVLLLPGGHTARFQVKTAPGYELTTLLVNGSSVDAHASDHTWRFSIHDVRGPIVITAIADVRTAAIQGVDPKTGVHYRLPGSSDNDHSNITEDSWISVVELTGGAAYEQALTDSRPYGMLLSAYDLSLHNGSGTYEPSVPVSVSFPVPASFQGGHLKVLRASGASVSEIPYRTEEIQGAPCVTVTVDGFSLYMLVDAPADMPQMAEEVSDDNQPDPGNMALFLLLLGLMGVALVLFFHKQRTAH